MPQQFLENPLEKIATGWLGPDIDMEALYGQFMQMIGGARRATGRQLEGAARGAGRVPAGLSQRLQAIGEAGERQAGVALAGQLSQFEQTRAMGALDRYYRYWGAQQQIATQEAGAWGSLFGGLFGSVMDLTGIGMMTRALGD